jgi:hypothetical protein
MSGQPVESFPSEDTVFRLRAKMEDYSYTRLVENERGLLAFRVPGEKIELLRSLEYLSEFLEEETLDDIEKVLIVSDKEYEITPGTILGPKMDTKKKDDERLFKELKDKLHKKMEPLVFTEENDILELFRTAIRLDGSVNRTDSSIGLDLIKIDLPSEGEVIYLIFDDGYRKLSKATFEKIADDAMQGLRQGPSLAKDPEQKGLTKSETLTGVHKQPKKTPGKVPARIKDRGTAIDTQTRHHDDPKVLLRDYSKKLVALGYRKDNLFSRPDVNQFFYVGMSGPALFIKVLEDKEELSSFLRILDHRKDALGILITKLWDPQLEAISRIRGFVYLDWQRAWRGHEVVKFVLKEGSS